MKKIFTSLALGLLAAVPAMAQVVYSTSFATEDEFKTWIVKDANEDEKTWSFAEDASPSKVFYTYHGTNAGDDWLISPEIVPAEDANLMVKFDYKGSSYGEALEVYCDESMNADSTLNTKYWEQSPIYDSEQGAFFFVQAKAGKPFRLGFHCTSPADKYRLFLIRVEVSKCDNPVDLTVAEMVSPVTGDALGQENVTLKIKNKGQVDVDRFTVGFRLDNGEAVTEEVKQTLAVGDSLVYTMNAKADLSLPRHLYEVKAFVHHDDDISVPNDTLVAKVRHKAPATVPYAMGFEPDDLTEDFKYFNLNEDDGEFKLNISSGWFAMSRTGFGCLAYNYDKQNAGNDWAILEPIQVKAGYHALKFWYSATENHPEKFAVYWGTEPTPEAMTHKIVEYNPAVNAGYEESINIVEFEKDQVVYIGFYCFSDADENWLTIDDLTLTEVSSTSADVAVNAISSPREFIRNAKERDLKVDLRNIGIIDVDVKVEVNIDGNSATAENYSLKAQEFKTVTMSQVLASLAEGKHTVQVVATCDKDENAANDTIVKEVVVLGTPVIYYDFEEGVLPADLTYEVKDEGTINPNAGEEYNAEGWGIFNLSKHDILGEHVLAGCSWIDNTTSVDRRIRFPRVHVGSGDAYFVFNSNSFNPNFLEDFKVYVCDDPDSEWGEWFSTVMSVNQEDIYTKARGISLSKYADKDIIVAIGVVSKNGEALILDNIGFYGDVEKSEATAINAAVAGADENTIRITDNSVMAENGARIIVNDASGRLVADGEGCAHIAALQNGVYMATVKTAKGTRTVKFIKR